MNDTPSFHPHIKHHDLGNRLVKGVGWTGLGQLIRLAAAAAALVVISRFVSPAQVGLATMALVILGVSNGIAALGPAQAIVQRAEITERHVQAAFQLSLLAGFVIAILVIIFANAFAIFFRNPYVADVLRVSALGVIIAVLPASQLGLLQRTMRFREYAFVTSGGAVLAAMSAIMLAVLGFGIWAVIVSQLFVGAFTFLLSLLFVPWPGTLRLRIREMKELFAFGANTSANVVTAYIAQNLPNFFVGRFLDAHTLGYYSMSFRTNELSFKQLQNAFTATMLPAVATFQTVPDRLRAIFVRSTRAGILFTSPPLLVLTVASRPLVEIMWGPEWLPAASILWRLCIAQIVLSVGMNVGTMFQAIGKPEFGWMWNLFCMVFFVPAYYYSSRFGAVGIASATALVAPILTIMQIIWVRHVLGLTAHDIWKMLWTPILVITASCVAALIARESLHAAGVGQILMLVATVGAGAAVYLLLVYFIDPDVQSYAQRVVLKRFQADA
jgi:O-antigen/teichoic acid export membrane protein